MEGSTCTLQTRVGLSCFRFCRLMTVSFVKLDSYTVKGKVLLKVSNACNKVRISSVKI